MIDEKGNRQRLGPTGEFFFVNYDPPDSMTTTHHIVMTPPPLRPSFNR